MSSITLTNLLSSFQGQEQRRVIIQEGVVEGALLVKHQDDGTKQEEVEQEDTRTK